MPSTTLRADEVSNLLGPWSTGSATLVDDLVQALTELIDSGLIPVGARMPPQRGLAQSLGVARGTVTAAYESLAGGGYLASRQGAGSVVLSGRAHLHPRADGRLFSFGPVPGDRLDLSTGALPASRVARDVLGRSPGGVSPSYLATDGYFPAGLPALRAAIADQLTRDGVPTAAGQILVTAGAQQATWVALTALLEPGALVLTEEPTYRGALGVMRSLGARIEGLPMTDGGIAPGQVAHALRRSPALLYCQTGIHNPTGRAMTRAARCEFAGIVSGRMLVIEDRTCADLTVAGPPTPPSLVGMVDPDLLVTIGGLSKLFWGGIRVGWVRGSESVIRGLSETLKPVQLACSVPDQLLAVELIRRTAEARAERRELLARWIADTEAALRRYVPQWTWERIHGGPGLWIDTGQDAVALAERAKREGIKLAAGPAFSAHGGQRTMLRFPVWHEESALDAALNRLAPLVAGGAPQGRGGA